MKLDDFEESAAPAVDVAPKPFQVSAAGTAPVAADQDDEVFEGYGAPYERTEKLLEDASMQDIFDVFSDLSLTYRKRIVIALKAQDHLELGEAFADAWEEHSRKACGLI